ncbi:alpha/beta hydrolase [Streptomyces sp. YIM S03343]
MWEPIIGAAGTAQPVPADVRTSEHHATAGDGAQIKMRWYVKDGATPGSAVLFFHGGGYIFGHIDLFDGPVARYVSASGVPMLSVEYRRDLIRGLGSRRRDQDAPVVRRVVVDEVVGRQPSARSRKPPSDYGGFVNALLIHFVLRGKAAWPVHACRG